MDIYHTERCDIMTWIRRKFNLLAMMGGYGRVCTHWMQRRGRRHMVMAAALLVLYCANKHHGLEVGEGWGRRTAAVYELEFTVASPNA